MSILKMFHKRKEKEQFPVNPYAMMGSLGISPDYLQAFNDAVAQIEKHKKEIKLISFHQ